jgi:hypothetical protein
VYAHRTSRLLLEERWDQLGLIQITDAIVHLASDLADRDALRGDDAVHLASALTAGDGAELLMVTWDDALGGAALRHGSSLASAPVEAVATPQAQPVVNRSDSTMLASSARSAPVVPGE